MKIKKKKHKTTTVNTIITPGSFVGRLSSSTHNIAQLSPKVNPDELEYAYHIFTAASEGRMPTANPSAMGPIMFTDSLGAPQEITIIDNPISRGITAVMNEFKERGADYGRDLCARIFGLMFLLVYADKYIGTNMELTNYLDVPKHRIKNSLIHAAAVTTMDWLGEFDINELVVNVKQIEENAKS